MNEKFLVREAMSPQELVLELNRLNPKEWHLVNVIEKEDSYFAFLQRIGLTASGK